MTSIRPGPAAARLTPRARLTWLAHLFKACVKQHHRELIAPLRRFIPADAVVLDAGGHAGQFAKLFARMAPEGRVYTVEPGSYALSILRPALAWNRLGNVTVVPVGLGDAPGTATLSVPVKRSGSLGFGLGRLADPRAAPDAARPSVGETVAVETLDRLAERCGLARLDFIKADIEGWEMRMIAGAGRTLARFRPSLMVEVNAAALAGAGDTPEALFAHFAAIGYRAYVLGPGLERYRPVEIERDGDVFFVPAERAAIMDEG